METQWAETTRWTRDRRSGSLFAHAFEITPSCNYCGRSRAGYWLWYVAEYPAGETLADGRAESAESAMQAADAWLAQHEYERQVAADYAEHQA